MREIPASIGLQANRYSVMDGWVVSIEAARSEIKRIERELDTL
jgi:hypothetical protein